ncbi:MAG: tRNA epoxyqueuosine(34) reductase QueG [Gemmatimonadales bacterium]
MTPERRSHLLKAYAHELGFDSAGITTLDPPPHADALLAWLDAGMAGTMTYLHRQSRRRREPTAIVPGATRAIVLTAGYYQRDTPPPPGSGRVAKYARGLDYHEALGGALERLATRIQELGPPGTIARPFVDAGPVPERELAQRAGLGWIGKNTMLIQPRRGSFFFLASVLTDLDLAVDAPFDSDRCGSCRRCLDACPTAAFPTERVLDSRRCISYLTIEYRGEIPGDLRHGMGRWVFGCDICQDVCPWNQKFATPARDGLLRLDPSVEHLDLEALLVATDEEFRQDFGATALDRPGATGMRRNARIARANGPDPASAS